MSDTEMSGISGGAPYNTSSMGSSSAASNGVAWRKTKIGLLSALLTIALAAIILGAVLPYVIDDMIDEGVREGVLLDPKTWSDTARQNFYNQTTHEDFYVFNLTNLYAVLTRGDKPNFQEVGPIKTRRYPNRYNVSFDIPNSRVSYNWLTTFEVIDDESRALLDQPIIAPNLVWFGIGAQVMRTYMSNAYAQGVPMPPGESIPPAEFPGRFLNEKIAVTGFMGSRMLPGINTVFRGVATSEFLKTIRSAAIIFYARFFQAFCAEAGVDYAAALGRWARNEPLGLPAAYWAGMELPRALTSENREQVALNAWNATNNFGFASAEGLNQWKTLGGLTPGSPDWVNQAMLIAQGLAIPMTSLQTDLPTLGAWISEWGAVLPSNVEGGSAKGDAYQRVVCAAISAQIAQIVQQGTPANTPFSRLYATPADWTVTTWDEVGALQFGTGLVAGFQLPGSTTTVSGLGASIADLQPVRNPALPFNFFNGAEQTEPPEFQQGIKYYVDNNANIPAEVAATLPPQADQSPLWKANRALLFVDPAPTATANTPRVLTVAQSMAFLDLFGNAAQSTNYGNVMGALQQVVVAYSTRFAAGLPTDRQPTPAEIGAAITAATTTAQGTLAAHQANSASPLSDDRAKVLITNENWYLVFSYLYNYVANEFTGTLAQLDPTTGLAPQNSGIFTKITVKEMLFGKYQARFPGVEIPLIAGELLDSKPYQQLLDEDFKAHPLGRQWVQDTGHRDLQTVGQWIAYEGTSAYEYNCDLVDPSRALPAVCGTEETEKANNWRAWFDNATIAGTGPSTQIQPWKEDDEDRPQFLTFYVTELKRAVTVEYKFDREVKGIDVRRYGLFEALTNMSYVANNQEKNVEKWRQGGVPDGLFSLSTVRGGVPAFSSLPHFGLTNPGEINPGATCDGGSCSEWYVKDTHETFIDVNPLTGIVLNGAKRLQANFRISAQEYYTGNYTGYPAAYPEGYNPAVLPEPMRTPGGLNFHYNNLFKNGETFYIPYYWGDIHDTVQDEDAADARDSMNTIKVGRRAKKGVLYAGTIGGSILTVLAVIGLVHYCRAAPRKTPYSS